MIDPLTLFPEDTFFCGVPDSLLKDFCAVLSEKTNARQHIIAANEGNAIALAAGYYLATGKPAVVYMQNSGLGNCVNPLLSLMDKEVYNIPVLLLIGWRGEPGIKDEPQHIKQGKVTDSLLKCMGIKYNLLECQEQIDEAFNYMKTTKEPYALIVRKGTFSKYQHHAFIPERYSLSREEAIEKVLSAIPDNGIVVSTTGHISREVYEAREKNNQSHKQDFLTVGSMGHASSIAMGIALKKENNMVFCLDGDGAALMHMGAIPVIASRKMENYKHIVFNNEAHDSVGSQPTVAGNIDFIKLALSCGYSQAFSVSTKAELEKILPLFSTSKGTILLEIKVKCGARPDLGRPKERPVENKKIFMQNLILKGT